MEFTLWLFWADFRLEYQNLKENPYRNKLPDTTVNELWKPELFFHNSQDRDPIKYTPLSSLMTLKRSGKGKEAPWTQLDEARVYDAENTTIALKTFHNLNFKCGFNFAFFPFDKQKCFVEVPKHFRSIFIYF